MGKAVLRVSAHFIVNLSRCGRMTLETVGHALPGDAKLVGGQYNTLTESLELMLESEQYPDPEAGGWPPQVPEPELRLVEVPKEE